MQYPFISRRPIKASAYGARASQVRVLRLLPRESERSGALACAPRKGWLCVGGHYWQVAPRSCTEGESPLAGTVPFHRVRANYNQRGTASARRKLACCASSPETASAVACSCARRARAGCVSEASAVTSQHGLVPKKRGFSPVRFFPIGYRPTTTSAIRRARVASSRAAPPPQNQLAQWRARVHAEQNPGVCWRPRLARRSTVLCRKKETSRLWRALLWSTDRLQSTRYDARVSKARVLRLLLKGSERSGALACTSRESRLCVGGRS